jgi:hypothetical protein
LDSSGKIRRQFVSYLIILADLFQPRTDDQSIGRGVQILQIEDHLVLGFVRILYVARQLSEAFYQAGNDKRRPG